MDGIRLLGDSSFWVWVRKNPNPRNDADAFETNGFMGGHVDDFNRAGNVGCPEWLEIRKKFDQAYAWGTVKRQPHRHTGIDLEVHEKGSESWVQLCQDYYTEGIPDLCVPPERLRGDPNNELNSNEISACRAALGALPWAATQPLADRTHCGQNDPSCEGDPRLDQGGQKQPDHLEALAHARSSTLARCCDCHLGRPSSQQQTSRRIYWRTDDFRRRSPTLGRKCWSPPLGGMENLEAEAQSNLNQRRSTTERFNAFWRARTTTFALDSS